MKFHARRTSGQAMVEFALVLPLLAILILGLTDVGMLFFAHVQVANAAREGTRAGSLYLGGRFHYTSCYSGQPCDSLDGYGDGGSDPGCWSLQDWVENALVERNRNASTGCDESGFKSSPVHAFGRLSPARCPSATSGANCWWLQSLVVTPHPSDPALPKPGDPIRVTVRYRYSMLFVSDLIPMFPETMAINRTVIMKVQNN